MKRKSRIVSKIKMSKSVRRNTKFRVEITIFMEHAKEAGSNQ